MTENRRVPVSFSEEYENEYKFLQNVRNRSKFICKALRKYLEDDDNLNELERFAKKQVYGGR